MVCKRNWFCTTRAYHLPEPGFVFFQLLDSLRCGKTHSATAKYRNQLTNYNRETMEPPFICLD